jgi:hypothetical protein
MGGASAPPIVLSGGGSARANRVRSVERPTRFEEHRWVGDKRTQVVHDVDAIEDPEHLADLMEARTYLCFGPDTLAEARNRGYHPCRVCARSSEGDEP